MELLLNNDMSESWKEFIDLKDTISFKLDAHLQSRRAGRNSSI